MLAGYVDVPDYSGDYVRDALAELVSYLVTFPDLPFTSLGVDCDEAAFVGISELVLDRFVVMSECSVETSRCPDPSL